MKEELYGLANHIAGAKGGLPQEWQDWASEIEMDIRKLANREAQPVGYFVRHRSAWDRPSKWRLWTECSAEDYAEFLKIIATGDADAGRFYEARILYDAPSAPVNALPVAWEMRYWNSGHNMWHDWERITAEQHAEMSVQHATDNDYEFRVLYDAPPATAVPKVKSWSYHYSPIDETQDFCKGWNACRAAMLAQPVSQGYKLPPHAYRELVNSLRDTAAKYHGTQQLREQLSRTLTENGLVAAAPGGGNG